MATPRPGRGHVRTNDDGEMVIETNLLDELRAIRDGQTQGFTEVRTALSGKADKNDVARLENRLDQHQEQIAKLEEGERLRRWQFTAREKVLAFVASVLLLAGPFLGPYIGSHI